MKKSKSGYILLHRSILNHPSYLTEPFCRQMAWIDLILLASWKNSSLNIRGIHINVPRGSLAYSSKSLSQRWRWSRGRVNRFLNGLQNAHQIEHQKTSVTTLITIVNYNKFQLHDTANDTGGRTSNGHQTDTLEYIKNKRKESEGAHFASANAAPLEKLVEKPPDPPPSGKLPNLEEIRRKFTTKKDLP